MKRQKIVLYNPRAVFFTLPLALLAVGSCLDPKRYDVRIIDGRLERDPLRAVLAELDDALCLGVTVLTGDPINDALAITRGAKERRPDLPTIWGGWHPSLFPTSTLEESAIDITVQGQGEETFGELVERLASGESLRGLQGISFRENGRTVQNPPRPLVDMNTLPRYNYDLIPVERYFPLKGKRQLDYISSTGCFFRCTFCADPFVYGRKWTAFEPKRMVDEIEDLWKHYRFEELAFQDETFFTYSDRVVAMAEEFIRRDMRFDWTATMRADQGVRLGEEMLSLCVRSGLRRVLIGVESGSQEMLDWMKKDIRIEQVIECAERCAELGIRVHFPFIIGFPGESEESVSATIEMVKRLRSMSPGFDTPIFYYKPYPGSQMAQDVAVTGYRMPETLQEWAAFDFVGSSGPWVSREKFRRIERFKFYNRLAWGRETLLRWPLQQVARWRCRRDFYSFPIEKTLVETLRPGPRLS
jgi:radical SAM superfamily enzyme YgiQ (UPF0313 family)